MNECNAVLALLAESALSRYRSPNISGVEIISERCTRNLVVVRSLAADNVIDYTKEDFAQNDKTNDLTIDVLGKSSFSQCKDPLKEAGKYLMTSFKMRDFFDMLRTILVGHKKAICAILVVRSEDLVLTKELVEAGALKAVNDKRFPLEQIADATDNWNQEREREAQL